MPWVDSIPSHNDSSPHLCQNLIWEYNTECEIKGSIFHSAEIIAQRRASVRTSEGARPYVFVSAEQGGDAATCCQCHLSDHWLTSWLGWRGGGCLTHTGCPYTVWAATVGSWHALHGGRMCVLHVCKWEVFIRERNVQTKKHTELGNLIVSVL